MIFKVTVVKPDEKKLISDLIETDKQFSGIESALRRARRRFILQLSFLLIVLFAGLAAAYIGGFTFLIDKSDQTKVPARSLPLLIVGLCIIILAYTSIPLFRTSRAQHVSFHAILPAVKKVDAALLTIPLSRERRALAQKLLNCASCINWFAPPLPRRLDKRIQQRQARQASDVVRNLVYPAILGSDKGLREIKGVLSQAAFMIGVSRWAEIGSLARTTDEYGPLKSTIQTKRSIPIVTITLAVFAAIPTIPALVGLFN